MRIIATRMWSSSAHFKWSPAFIWEVRVISLFTLLLRMENVSHCGISSKAALCKSLLICFRLVVCWRGRVDSVDRWLFFFFLKCTANLLYHTFWVVKMLAGWYWVNRQEDFLSPTVIRLPVREALWPWNCCHASHNVQYPRQVCRNWICSWHSTQVGWLTTAAADEHTESRKQAITQRQGTSIQRASLELSSNKSLLQWVLWQVIKLSFVPTSGCWASSPSSLEAFEKAKFGPGKALWTDLMLMLSCSADRRSLALREVFLSAGSTAAWFVKKEIMFQETSHGGCQ